MYYPMPNENSSTATVFLSLLSAGAGLMFFLLLVVLVSPQIQRHPTWLSFCITWIVFPLSYILLYIFGKARGPEPPFSLCLTQAALIYAAPVLSGAASLSLNLRVWIDQRSTMKPELARACLPFTIGLVSFPWILFVGVITEVLVIGLRSRGEVQRTGAFAYCAIRTGIPGHISAFIIALILLLCFAAQFAIGMSFAKHYRQMEKAYRAKFPTDVMIRLAAFMLIALCVVGVVMTFSKSDLNRIVIDGAISPMPLIIFLIFGIQKDVVNVILFRKRAASRPDTDPVATDFSSIMEVT